MTLDDFAVVSAPETCPECEALEDGDLCFKHYLESEAGA